MLDHSDMQNQFLGLVWRGARIDHASNEHDDFAAAVARLTNVLQVPDMDISGIVLCGERGTTDSWDGMGVRSRRPDW